MTAPIYKGNSCYFFRKLNKFLPTLIDAATAAATYLAKSDATSTYLAKSDATSTYLTQTNAASTYLAKSDATIAIRYATSNAGAGMSETDAAGMTHIGILKKAGLDATDAANYTWIARTIPE